MGAPISARIASRKCFMEGSSPAAASISVAGTEERVAGDAVGIREFARSAAWATIACPSPVIIRSEEHTSELQSLMRISYAVFCFKKKSISTNQHLIIQQSSY